MPRNRRTNLHPKESIVKSDSVSRIRMYKAEVDRAAFKPDKKLGVERFFEEREIQIRTRTGTRELFYRRSIKMPIIIPARRSVESRWESYFRHRRVEESNDIRCKYLATLLVLTSPILFPSRVVC